MSSGKGLRHSQEQPPCRIEFVIDFDMARHLHQFEQFRQSTAVLQWTVLRLVALVYDGTKDVFGWFDLSPSYGELRGSNDGEECRVPS